MGIILITGANRGIGKALAKIYMADGWHVIAAVRNINDCDLDCQKIHLDLTDAQSIAALKDYLGDIPIDILWNNAGIFNDKNTSLEMLSDSDWMQSFLVNTIAPMRLSSLLRKNIIASQRKLFIYTSSSMASIAGPGMQSYAYRTSKTALNMAVSKFAMDIRDDGASAMVIHPGWVRTDMGGDGADISAQTSVIAMKKLVETITPNRQNEFNGTYRNYEGGILPW